MYSVLINGRRSTAYQCSALHLMIQSNSVNANIEIRATGRLTTGACAGISMLSLFAVTLSSITFGIVLLGPSHPQNVEVRATSSVSIHVKWEEPAQPNGKITEYIISYGTSKDSQPREETVTGSTMERVLDGLNKFTTYFIKVRGKTSERGNASKILNATTYEDSKYHVTACISDVVC